MSCASRGRGNPIWSVLRMRSLLLIGRDERDVIADRSEIRGNRWKRLFQTTVNDCQSSLDAASGKVWYWDVSGEPHSWRHPTCVSRGCWDLEGWPIIRFSPPPLFSLLTRPLFLLSSFHPLVTQSDGVTPRTKRYPVKSSPRKRQRRGGKHQRRVRPPCCIALVNFCAEASRFFSPSTHSRLRCPGRSLSLLPFLPVNLPLRYPSIASPSWLSSLPSPLHVYLHSRALGW